jgi:VWFA-related protein
MKTAVLSLLLGLAPSLCAQIVLNPPRDASVIHMDVDLVNVLCSVRDKHGTYAKGLNKDDFEIKEDGHIQVVTHFARDVDSPMTVALLLDVSGSVHRILEEEKTAASRFFHEVMRPGDSALVTGFAQVIAVWRDLTESKADLLAAIEQASAESLPKDPEFQPHGGTLLYDAVNMVALQKLMRLPGRKAMILISDGEDIGSFAGISTAVQAAQQADAVVYGIHYKDAGSPDRRGLEALTQLSEPTGGRAFHVNAKMPLSKIFAGIAEEMRNQYGLGYRPAKSAPGTFHKLEVRAKKSGLKTQVRSGYFSAGR